jgi:hypothetical protein
MPPHCDSLDGPVVNAARAALETGDVEVVLPFVPADGETEVRDAFALVHEARSTGAAEFREYVEAMLGLQVWAHGVHRQLLAEPHQHAGAHR